MFNEPETFRTPFFSIVSVVEARGRSMADIVAEVAGKHRVSMRELRGPGQTRRLTRARFAAYSAIQAERPDLSSSQVGVFMNRDGSTIRHYWARVRAAA